MRKITSKQVRVLIIICRGNKDGSFVDMDQIMEGGFYHHTKQSMQFTIRSLIERGLIAKKPNEIRRCRRRVVFAATEHGYELNKKLSGGAPLSKAEMGELEKLLP